MKTIIRIIGCVLLGIIFSGCKDFEEVRPSNNQMLWEDVFNDSQTSRAAMSQVYADMRQNGFFTGNGNGIGCLAGSLSDELVAYSNIADSYRSFYALELTDGNKTVKPLWNSSYSQIYMCNSVLKGIAQSNLLDEGIKKQLRGEALFTRALLHFYLTNSFGDIPYISITDYNQNRSVGRMKPSEVYQRVLDDLQEAASLLPMQQDVLKTYPSKNTAYALMSRVYLYNKEYAKAYATAVSLLQNKDVSVLQPLEKVFLKESAGTLWQFATSTASANTLEGGFYMLAAAPSTRTALQPDLVNAFETDDLRKKAWIGSVTGGLVFNFPAKYKENRPSATSKEYSVIFRIEEQYLIAAEAASALAQWEDANHWLTVFKDSRGLAHVSSDAEEILMAEIEQQRRLEFFTEFGHRFYDLKRWNKLNQTMIALKPNWNVRFALFPIPQSELQLNPNLRPQNAGY